MEQGVDLDGSLRNRGQSAFGTFTCGTKTAKRTGIFGDVILEVFEKVVIKVLATQMGVTSGGLDRKYTTSDIEQGDIESSSAKVKDQYIAFGLRLLVKAVSNGSRGRLVNDTENIKSRN